MTYPPTTETTAEAFELDEDARMSALWREKVAPIFRSDARRAAINWWISVAAVIVNAISFALGVANGSRMAYVSCFCLGLALGWMPHERTKLKQLRQWATNAEAGRNPVEDAPEATAK